MCIRDRCSTHVQDKELAIRIEDRHKKSLKYPSEGVPVFVVDDWFDSGNIKGHDEIVYGFDQMQEALHRSHNKLAEQIQERKTARNQLKEDLKPWKNGKRQLAEIRQFLQKQKKPEQCPSV